MFKILQISSGLDTKHPLKKSDLSWTTEFNVRISEQKFIGTDTNITFFKLNLEE